MKWKQCVFVVCESVLRGDGGLQWCRGVGADGRFAVGWRLSLCRCLWGLVLCPWVQGCLGCCWIVAFGVDRGDFEYGVEWVCRGEALVRFDEARRGELFRVEVLMLCFVLWACWWLVSMGLGLWDGGC